MRILILMLFLVASESQAFTDGPVIWACSKGNNNSAVVVKNNPVPGEFGYIVKINDPQICKTLGLSCPFISPAKTSVGGNGFIALADEYGTGAIFQKDNGGIKLNAIWVNRESGRFQTSQLDWYFNPGECVRF